MRTESMVIADELVAAHEHKTVQEGQAGGQGVRRRDVCWRLETQTFEGSLHWRPSVREDDKGANAGDMRQEYVEHVMHVFHFKRVHVVVALVEVRTDDRSDHACQALR